MIILWFVSVTYYFSNIFTILAVMMGLVMDTALLLLSFALDLLIIIHLAEATFILFSD